MKKYVKEIIILVILFWAGFILGHFNIMGPFHETGHVIAAYLSGETGTISTWSSTMTSGDNMLIFLGGYWFELIFVGGLSLLFNYKGKNRLMLFFLGAFHNTIINAYGSSDFLKAKNIVGNINVYWTIIAFTSFALLWLMHIIILNGRYQKYENSMKKHTKLQKSIQIS